MPKRIGGRRCYLREPARALAGWRAAAGESRPHRAAVVGRASAVPQPRNSRMSLPSLLPSARRCVPLAAAALLYAALPTPAPAAVAGVDKAITVTSNTSDVLLAGFANNAAVSVVRDGVTIATAKNKNDPAASPAEGGVNSAHLAGLGGCWTSFTPQLLPGDTIKVGTDSTVVRGITAEPLRVEGGEIVVRGSAVSVPGAPVTSDQ